MARRHVYDVELRPVLGSTFQPTGFPDLGAATFDRWDGERTVPALLVESVQSMANRLEAVGWDAAAQQPVEVLKGLPYVRVVRDSTDDFLTSSRLEAHRLASPFVREATHNGSKMEGVIADRLGLAKNTPLDYRRMARAVMEMDPMCLVHGVFFSQKSWLGQPKFPRAVRRSSRRTTCGVQYPAVARATPCVTSSTRKRGAAVRPRATARFPSTAWSGPLGASSPPSSSTSTCCTRMVCHSRPQSCWRRWRCGRSVPCCPAGCGCVPRATSRLRGTSLYDEARACRPRQSSRSGCGDSSTQARTCSATGQR